jgi:septal ring factor EnvC (AmiA/AmiB activator)
MPVKKSVSATQKADDSKKDHKHAELEKSIAALKKEIQNVKNQCSNCCKELAEAKSQIAALKSANQPEAKDSRVDELFKNIVASFSYDKLRKIYKIRK